MNAGPLAHVYVEKRAARRAGRRKEPPPTDEGEMQAAERSLAAG